jgi:hypothetical protein
MSCPFISELIRLKRVNAWSWALSKDSKEIGVYRHRQKATQFTETGLLIGLYSNVVE